MAGGRHGGEAGPALVGIDVGTTSVRAIAFDRRGHRLAGASRPTPLKSLPTGGEYDPDAIFEAVLAVLAEVGQSLAGRPVAGLAVASIGESCVLIDADGRALAPSIAWFDRRSAAEAEAIEAKAGRERVFGLSGHAVEHIFTLPKLLWMRKHWPEALARARRVLMMADWVAYRLSGVAATDPTLASRTLAYDLGGGAWSAEMLALAGLTPDAMAPLRPSGAALGPMRAEALAATGLAGNPVVGVGGHDHIVGAFASGLARPGTVLNSIGTAEALLLAIGAPLADPKTIERGYVQGAAAAGGLFYVCASLFSAGGAMEWARAMLGDAGQETLIAEAMRIPPGSQGVTFLPHLANGPPPEPDPDARGAFLGLAQDTGRAALYRAVVEGVALQSRLMLDGMATLDGVGAVETIRLIGGVARNPLFLQVKANAFGRPLTVVDEPEGTALGAALFGGLASGLWPDAPTALAGLDRHERIVEPDENLQIYQELVERFGSFHRRIQPVNRAVAARHREAPRQTP